jgi:uncharacterized OB-fold protein
MAPKKFAKFRDVMEEAKKSGAAIYQNPVGTNDLVVLSPYSIKYIHSYAEDSEFFLGLADGKLLGSECKNCGTKYATPRSHCMNCGHGTQWFKLPLQGKVHSWTTCYFGSEEFLKETPFNLVLVEFEGVNSFLLSRLTGVEQKDIYIGMKVKAEFRAEPRYLISDVHFVPAGAKTLRK